MFDCFSCKKSNKNKEQSNKKNTDVFSGKEGTVLDCLPLLKAISLYPLPAVSLDTSSTETGISCSQPLDSSSMINTLLSSSSRSKTCTVMQTFRSCMSFRICLLILLYFYIRSFIKFLFVCINPYLKILRLQKMLDPPAGSQ